MSLHSVDHILLLNSVVLMIFLALVSYSVESITWGKHSA